MVLFTPNPSSRTHICSTSPSLSTFCMHFHTVGSVVDASTGDPLGRKNGDSSTFSKNSRSSVYRIASGRELSSSSSSKSSSSFKVFALLLLLMLLLLLLRDDDDDDFDDDFDAKREKRVVSRRPTKKQRGGESFVSKAVVVVFVVVVVIFVVVVVISPCLYVLLGACAFLSSTTKEDSIYPILNTHLSYKRPNTYTPNRESELWT